MLAYKSTVMSSGLVVDNTPLMYVWLASGS